LDIRFGEMVQSAEDDIDEIIKSSGIKFQESYTCVELFEVQFNSVEYRYIDQLMTFCGVFDVVK
jgi:hypothetical protein